MGQILDREGTCLQILRWGSGLGWVGFWVLGSVRAVEYSVLYVHLAALWEGRHVASPSVPFHLLLSLETQGMGWDGKVAFAFALYGEIGRAHV